MPAIAWYARAPALCCLALRVVIMGSSLGHPLVILVLRWATLGYLGMSPGRAWANAGLSAGYRGGACSRAACLIALAGLGLPFVACRVSCIVPGLAGLSWAMPWLSYGYHKAIYQSIMVRLWLALDCVVGHSWVSAGLVLGYAGYSVSSDNHP